MSSTDINFGQPVTLSVKVEQKTANGWVPLAGRSGGVLSCNSPPADGMRQVSGSIHGFDGCELPGRADAVEREARPGSKEPEPSVLASGGLLPRCEPGEQGRAPFVEAVGPTAQLLQKAPQFVLGPQAFRAQSAEVQHAEMAQDGL